MSEWCVGGVCGWVNEWVGGRTSEWVYYFLKHTVTTSVQSTKSLSYVVVSPPSLLPPEAVHSAWGSV